MHMLVCLACIPSFLLPHDVCMVNLQMHVVRSHIFFPAQMKDSKVSHTIHHCYSVMFSLVPYMAQFLPWEDAGSQISCLCQLPHSIVPYMKNSPAKNDKLCKLMRSPLNFCWIFHFVLFFDFLALAEDVHNWFMCIVCYRQVPAQKKTNVAF